MNPSVDATLGARQRLTLVACFATMFMLGIAISMLGPSLPALAERTGIPLSQAGIFFSLFAAGSVLATLLLARYNDRPVRHALLIGGSLVMGTSFWLVATSHTFMQAGVGVALCGLSMSTVGTAPNAIIVDLFRDRAGQALNALHVVVGVGAFAGPLLIGAAIRSGSDYRSAYDAAAAAMLVVCVLWIVSQPPRPQRAAAGDRSAWRSLLSTLILVFALAMLYTGAEQVIGGWLFTYAQGTTAMQAVTASLLVALFWLAILLGRLAAVRILRRLTNLELLRACTLIGAAGIGVLLLGGSVAGFAVDRRDRPGLGLRTGVPDDAGAGRRAGAGARGRGREPGRCVRLGRRDDPALAGRHADAQHRHCRQRRRRSVAVGCHAAMSAGHRQASMT